MMKMRLVIRGIAKAGNTIYLVPAYLNGIIAVDQTAGTTHFISMCEKGNRVGEDLYEDIFVSDGMIWCSPRINNQIVLYDLSKQKFAYHSLPALQARGRTLFRCGGILETDGQIVILPLEYPGILKINKNGFQMKVVEWKEGLYQKSREDSIKRLYAMAKDYEIDGEEIYLLNNNYLLIYNLIDDRIKSVEICHEHKNFTGIVKWNEKFILLDRLHAALFEWTQEEHILKQIDVDWDYDGTDTENEEGDGCPVGLFKIKERVIILLAASRYLYLLDKNYQVEKIPLAMESIEEYGSKWHYMCYEFDGRNLYLPVCYENKVLIVDTETWEQETVEIQLDKDDEETIFENAMTAEKPVAENILFYSLEYFIDRLINA